MNNETMFQQLIAYWNNDMLFNELLGLEIPHLDAQKSEIRFDWKDTLVGNIKQKILHGGITASALDLAGGAVVDANIIDRCHLR